MPVDQKHGRPNPLWYGAGTLIMLVSLVAGWFMCCRPINLPLPDVIATAYSDTPQEVIIDRSGQYAIFVPGWQDRRRTAALHCTVTTSSGAPLPTSPPSRGNLLLDYDTSFLEWSASFIAPAPGRYTLLCNGAAGTDYFQITDEPPSPGRRTVLAQRIAMVGGLLLGAAVIAWTVVRRGDLRM